MKKIFYLISILTITIAFSSCKEELEIWDSETLEYSGRFVVDLYTDDMTELIDDGYEFRIYNTSANVANEVWIDDIDGMFPLKSKFMFTGNSGAFKSSSEEFTKLTDNILSTYKLPTPAPTALSQTKSVVGKEYVKAVVLEGKILPLAATTVGGNKSDSIYMKVKLYSGTANYTSIEVPLALRKDPEKAEFKWKFESSTVDAALDETYAISGHRYSGMPEDR